MYTTNIQSLLRVKQVIDSLKAIDTTALTKTERDAVQDCLQQAYDRADSVLQGEREIPMISQLIQDTTTVSILHELDLGQHTLFLMDDGSIYLLTDDVQMGYLADNGVRLDAEETYLLFISLQEQFKKKE